MRRKQGVILCIGLALLAFFVLWTVLVRTIDVASIGPNGTSVGFATVNQLVHSHIGVNMVLYTITDWLGLVPFLAAIFFAVIGFVQLINRRSLKKVDRSIIILGIFYIAIIFVYFFFEIVVINYRPVLIEGMLEASYPSSTTMLVTAVMPTAIMQCRERVKNRLIMHSVSTLICIFIIFMVVGRVISGVHWITDIVGGLLASSGLVLVYYSISN